ncbi:MAG: accessory gene regulator B family protein [Atribacterota bacterium]|nr:accessory gene regulator B family protein [Atribacterota bacterium]
MLFFETKIDKTLEKNFNYSQIEKYKIKYLLLIILSELSKFILLALIFNFLGYLSDFMLLTLSLLIFRPQIGGLHFNSYLKCFLITFVFSLTIILSKNLFLLNTNTTLILGLFNLLAIYFLAPLFSKYKKKYLPPRTSWKITSLALLHIVALLILPQNPYLLVTIWALFFQSLQLIIGRGCEIYEEIFDKYIK